MLDFHCGSEFTIYVVLGQLSVSAIEEGDTVAPIGCKLKCVGRQWAGESKGVIELNCANTADQRGWGWLWRQCTSWNGYFVNTVDYICAIVCMTIKICAKNCLWSSYVNFKVDDIVNVARSYWKKFFVVSYAGIYYKLFFFLHSSCSWKKLLNKFWIGQYN